MAIKLMATWSIVIGLLAVAAPAPAQLRYVDSQGVVHWVQSQNQIPPEYREKAEQPKLPDIDATKGEDPAARSRRKVFEAESARQRVLEDARRGLAESEAQFDRAAAACAQRSRVDINFKGGTRHNILGTETQRFAFDKCMSQSGHPTESAR